MSPPRPNAEYIGDGVYVWPDPCDGYMIWLATERDEGWHQIALERPVYENLVAFARQVWKLP